MATASLADDAGQPLAAAPAGDQAELRVLVAELRGFGGKANIGRQHQFNPAGKAQTLHGGHDGQIFALAVMAVAASEVVVGLGLIVAIARKRLDLDVDRLRVLRG